MESVTHRANGKSGNSKKIAVTAVDFHHWINPMSMVAGRANADPRTPSLEIYKDENGVQVER
ncbi:hypothetical protein DWU98_19370 [Dyella monticola]|uniref:Uncharacterized protein n=1 Tax=Dyella monticola TaxID=1927958 RepID=A0A370WTA2_9GAMM|nr:hypothetical protein [Dyella monticola]RDS79165.1 hypothetical protein DWU98_19370 [Dyella monticola]